VQLPERPCSCVRSGRGRPTSGAPRRLPPHGPQFLKAGYAADNLPRWTFPSIVGRPVLRAEEEAIGDVELKVRRGGSALFGRPGTRQLEQQRAPATLRRCAETERRVVC
jgi:hypothetical protein